jgi:uncharacterized protein (DUF302 family)
MTVSMTVPGTKLSLFTICTPPVGRPVFLSDIGVSFSYPLVVEFIAFAANEA